MGAPSGTVTFLFTDIEGSTRLWQLDEAAMREAVRRHDELLQATINECGGVVFSTMGDGMAAAFTTAYAALGAAELAQDRLSKEEWSLAEPVRVRIGLHSGEAEERDGDFFGTAVNRAARLMAIGHGGQVLCSSTTAELVEGNVALVDLGEHRLRDLDRPMHVFQVGKGSFPPLRSLSAFPGNLPRQLTSFVGRQAELISIAKALEASRLVTLTGTGGVGKTRLAVQAAANLVTSFPDGVWLCELAAAAAPESMLQVIAAALGYTPAPGAPLDRGIPEFVGSRRLLVVLDNCEHLLDPAAGFTQTVLDRCPNLAILATSREALEVRGERVIRLRSLPVPQAAASLDQLGEFDAALLFLDRADAAGADQALKAADGPAIAEICRRLDGIPLAIELAAARVIALSPGEIAAHLDERFRLLTGGRRAAVERHHTLRATIDWSYALLSERDQTVFNHLGVFPASFDATAAQAVAGANRVEPWDVLDALTSMVAKSMLNADRSGTGPTRYQMLESLRHYARERLDATAGTDDARRCHARHYAAAATAIGSGLIGPEELSWRERLYADVDNFRAAVGWSLDSASEEDGEFAMVILGELVLGMAPGRSGLFAGADEQAVERARRAAPRYSSLVLAYAAANAFVRGDLRRGRQLSREALQGVRVSPHPGRIYSVSFIFVDPQRLAEEVAAAVPLLDEVGAELWDYAQVHGSAAGMAAALGNVELALQEVPVALEISRRIGNPTLLALALYALGLASWQSDPTAAQAALEEHVQIIRATGHDFVLPRVLALLAQLRARTDLPAAVQTLQEGLQRAQMNGDRPAIAVCLVRGTVVMAALGDLETAAIFLGAVTDGALARLGALPSNELPTHNEFVTTLRSQLDDDRYRAATARGATMTYEQITTFALAARQTRMTR
jgi:predicted ATPase/class 3 adenylate cyclase/tetratricopeptide (TPR) repeat protein